MSNTEQTTVYSCDWIREDGDQCTTKECFEGVRHGDAAREAGWGSYANAHIRWERWGNGGRAWYCQIHATQFSRNHGWGGLESFEPPTLKAKPTPKRRWWQ